VPESPLLTGRSFLPQLKGDKTASREWLYSWYQAREKDPLKVFTRNIQYKLYKTGEFHDLFDDIQEKNPLKVEDLSGEALRVKAELQEVLDRFKDLEGKRSKKHPKT
jgi:arylsulfatase A